MTAYILTCTLHCCHSPPPPKRIFFYLFLFYLFIYLLFFFFISFHFYYLFIYLCIYFILFFILFYFIFFWSLFFFFFFFLVTTATSTIQHAVAPWQASHPYLTLGLYMTLTCLKTKLNHWLFQASAISIKSFHDYTLVTTYIEVSDLTRIRKSILAMILVTSRYY